MQDFEKLGWFYLGRPLDANGAKLVPDTPLLYDSRDLVTHAMIVGMTGSGKTGLGIGLLEEAAIDGVPALVIDPKGDLADLLLTFPDLKPEDFLPWVREEDAQRKGVTREALAASEAAKWRDGLASWGEDGERIRRLRAAAEVALYTPGSELATPISILSSFAAPARESSPTPTSSAIAWRPPRRACCRWPASTPIRCAAASTSWSRRCSPRRGGPARATSWRP